MKCLMVNNNKKKKRFVVKHQHKKAESLSTTNWLMLAAFGHGYVKQINKECTPK